MPRKSLLAEVAAALVTILPKMKDPQHCKPGDLVKFLNSTPAGQVLTPARLRIHRDRAGLRIGDEKTVDLFRYVAWLAGQWKPPQREPTPPPAPPPQSEDPNEIVLRTRAEAAAYFGVDERTIAKWLTLGDFPGKAGTRGQRNGYFPAGAIEAWRDGRLARGEDVPESDGKNVEQAGLIRAKRQLAELDLAERLGQLVDVTEVTGRMSRLTAEAAAVLRQIPAEITAQIVEEVLPDSAARIRKLASVRVEQALRCLVKACQALADEAEHEEEEEIVDGQPGEPVESKPSPKRAAPQHKKSSRKRPAKRRGRA